MTLEKLIFLFIPKGLFFQGAKLSKVALPCSKQLLKGKRELERVRWAQCVVWGSPNGVCYERAGAPLFIQGARAVLWLFLAWSPSLHHLSMLTCHRLSKGWPRGANGGSLAPRGKPPPNQVPSPLPSCGGLWDGPGLLLGWFFIRMMKVAGRFYYSIAQIRVGKRLLVKFSMHLCLCPTK